MPVYMAICLQVCFNIRGVHISGVQHKGVDCMMGVAKLSV